MSYTTRENLEPTVQNNNSRWNMLCLHDPDATDIFYYGTITTKIYCTNKCPSRLPKRKHVCFFDSAIEAEAAGFRPCLRCNPRQGPLDEQHIATVVHLCRFIEKVRYIPTLAELSDEVKVSAHYLHHLFYKITGLTPRGYAKTVQMERIREALRCKNRITEAIGDAGYASISRFYLEARKFLGMTPSCYRNGGKNTLIHFVIHQCPFGYVLIARSARGICEILLDDNPDILVGRLHHHFPLATLQGGDDDFRELANSTFCLVDKSHVSPHLPLDIHWAVFRQKIFQTFSGISAGKDSPGDTAMSMHSDAVCAEEIA